MVELGVSACFLYAATYPIQNHPSNVSLLLAVIMSYLFLVRILIATFTGTEDGACYFVEGEPLVCPLFEKQLVDK
jgi:hypothetical protein